MLVRWQPKARKAYFKRLAYIRRDYDDPTYYIRLDDMVVEQERKLAKRPYSGRKSKKKQGVRYVKLPDGPFFLVFKVYEKEGEVVIFGLYHTSQNDPFR